MTEARIKLKLAMVFLFCCFVTLLSFGDIVYLRDGGQVEGVLLSFQNNTFQLKTMEGEIREFKRADVLTIELRRIDAELPMKKLSVELKNIMTDDYLDIFVNSQIVVEKARESGEWKDITPFLKDGANELKIKVHNDGGVWAYKWALKINGKVLIQQCGEPNRPMAQCQRFGMNGKEIGVIDGIPPLWLYVDFHRGTCEIVKEHE